jgi:hypothetical protein
MAVAGWATRDMIDRIRGRPHPSARPPKPAASIWGNCHPTSAQAGSALARARYRAQAAIAARRHLGARCSEHLGRFPIARRRRRGRGQAPAQAAAPMSSAVRTGITSLADALANASVVLTAAIICAGPAGADPSQQDQFVALLEQEQIPPIDNVPALIARAHQICGELDGGTPVETVVNDEMNFAFGDNPALHLRPDRVRRTAIRFITASVDVYCPSHQGELPPYA